MLESSRPYHITRQKLGFKEAAQENDDTLAAAVAVLGLWPWSLMSLASIHETADLQVG